MAQGPLVTLTFTNIQTNRKECVYLKIEKKYKLKKVNEYNTYPGMYNSHYHIKIGRIDRNGQNCLDLLTKCQISTGIVSTFLAVMHV